MWCSQDHSDRNEGAAGGEIELSVHLPFWRRVSVTIVVPNCVQIRLFAMNVAHRCAASETGAGEDRLVERICKALNGTTLP